MPLLNLLKIYGADIAQALEAGERPLAVGLYRGPHNPDTRGFELADSELSPGEQRFLQEHGRRLPDSDKAIELGQINGHVWQRLISGSAGWGSPTSYAGRMWRAGTALHRSSTVHWVVTDRRFLLMVGPRPGSDGPWSIGFEVPRSAVRSARRRFKLLFAWGQVEVTFVDDSMVAILAGMLDVRLANRLISALTGPR